MDIAFGFCAFRFRLAMEEQEKQRPWPTFAGMTVRSPLFAE
jgi:hypothetical protein